MTVELVREIWNNLSTSQLIELQLDHNIDSLKKFSKVFKGFY